jgi:hypothetical protein
MRVKLIEVRDRMTLIAAVAIEIQGSDGFLARHAGYRDACVLFGRAAGGRFSYDPYDWNDRTMKAAHQWIAEHFDELRDGGVVDVEFILGEVETPKRSAETEVA